MTDGTKEGESEHEKRDVAWGKVSVKNALDAMQAVGLPNIADGGPILTHEEGKILQAGFNLGWEAALRAAAEAS